MGDLGASIVKRQVYKYGSVEIIFTSLNPGDLCSSKRCTSPWSRWRGKNVRLENPEYWTRVRKKRFLLCWCDKISWQKNIGEKGTMNELTVHRSRQVKAGTEAAPHHFHPLLGVERNGRVLGAQCSGLSLLCPLISNPGSNLQNAVPLSYQTTSFYLYHRSECHQTVSEGYSRQVLAGLQWTYLILPVMCLNQDS